MKSHFHHITILFLLLCGGIVLRLSNFDFVLENFVGHLNFYDPDAYYQLRKIFYSLHHHLKPLYFDPLANWPSGMLVDWPEGYTLILSTIAYPFKNLDDRSIELFLNFINILIGSALIPLGYFTAKQLKLSSSIWLLVSFFVAISPSLIRYSSLGFMDHHGLEALSIPLMILLGFLWKAKFSESLLFAVVLGGLSFCFLTVSSSSMISLAILFLFLIFFANEISLKSRFLFYGSLLILLVPYAVFHSLRLHQIFGLTYASGFHISLIIVGILSVELKSGLTQNKKLAPVTIAGLSLAILLVLSLSSLRETFLFAIRYSLGLGKVLAPIVEAQPLFFKANQFNPLFAYWNLGISGFLIPIFYLFLIFRWRHLSKNQKWLVFSSCITLVFALFQKRFVHFYVVTLFFIMGVFLEHLRMLMDSKKIRVFPAVAALFVCFQLAPCIQFGFVPKPLALQRVDLSIAKLFLEKLDLDHSVRQARLNLETSALASIPGGIWASPNQGHLLEYLTGLPVLTDVFYRMEGFERDYQLRTADRINDFVETARNFKLKYLFFQNDYSYFDFLHSALDKDETYYKGNLKHPLPTKDWLQTWKDLVWIRAQREVLNSNDLKLLTIVQLPENFFYNRSLIYELRP